MNTWSEVEEPKPEAVTAMGWLRVGVRATVLIGLVFGIHPARKAALISPDESIRS